MRFATLLLLITSVTVAHAQRPVQIGDICDYRRFEVRPENLYYIDPCWLQDVGPSVLGPRAEVLTLPHANPECPGQFRLNVRTAYTMERAVLIDLRGLRNCVDRGSAPETLALHRQADAEKHRRAAAEAAQAPIDERGGQLIQLPPEMLDGIGYRLSTHRYPCPQVREVYHTAQYRYRVRCAAPGGPPMPWSVVIHINYTNGAQEFQILRTIKHH